MDLDLELWTPAKQSHTIYHPKNSRHLNVCFQNSILQRPFELPATTEPPPHVCEETQTTKVVETRSHIVDEATGLGLVIIRGEVSVIFVTSPSADLCQILPKNGAKDAFLTTLQSYKPVNAINMQLKQVVAW